MSIGLTSSWTLAIWSIGINPLTTAETSSTHKHAPCSSFLVWLIPCAMSAREGREATVLDLNVAERFSGCNSGRAKRSVASKIFVRNMKSIIVARSFACRIALGLCLLSMLESTGEAAVGTNVVIKQIGISNTGTIGWVEVVGTLGFVSCTNPPNTTPLNGWAFDYSTPKGKGVLQLLTAAQLSGKRVSIYGDGVCINVPRSFTTGTVVDSVNEIRVE
jgi:hypothetical protein